MEVQHIFLVNQNWKDINPMECGQERCAPGHSFGPGVRDYYILHYVLSGVGRFTVSGTTYTLHAGDIFVIRPFERIYYEADAEAPWHYVWAGFEASVPLPEALSQDVIRCPDARAVFLEMLEAGKLEQGRERCLCGRIWLLLSMLEHMESAGPRGSDYVLRAVNWMQTNYMNPVSISALAGELNLDRSYFSTLFRRQTGRSPQQYLTELRLEKARTLLLEYGYRPGEAAQAVGYADIFSFSRMFKRRYGVSPSTLRWYTKDARLRNREKPTRRCRREGAQHICRGCAQYWKQLPPTNSRTMESRGTNGVSSGGSSRTTCMRTERPCSSIKASSSSEENCGISLRYFARMQSS